MEKLYIATREEFLTLINEGVKQALGGLSFTNPEPQRPPAGTKSEVAAYLQISKTKLDVMTKSGEIKCFRIGNQVRFKWDDIENYLQSKG